MNEHATLLYEWRQTRLKLKDDFSDKNLQNSIDFWKSVKYHQHGLDYDRPSTWPDVWEYITEQHYTNSGHGIGCFYTVYHARPDLNPEIWLIHDLLHGDMYLVCYVDGYILNRMSGKLERYEDVKDDLDILEKFTAEKVVNAVKERNSK